jgi:hypothetical protein
MSSLATIRANVRKDLHDEDAAAYRWTDAVLQRHIERALREFSFFAPLEKKNTVSTVAGTRDIDISALAPRLRLVAVEWPTGAYPPTYIPFIVWGDTLTLDVVGAPTSIQNVSVLWHGVHTINGTTTFPATDDDLIALGSAGFAALDWASFAMNRVSVGGQAVWGRYEEFGRARLDEFFDRLKKLPQYSQVRTSQMYPPQEARLKSQTTDPGPV